MYLLEEFNMRVHSNSLDRGCLRGLRDFLIPKSGSNYMLVNHDQYYHLSQEIVPLLKSLMKR